MKINESNIKFNGLKYGNNPKEIIIHNADSKNCSVYDVDMWHKNNGWAGIGYHYFIRKDGSIWRGREEKFIGAHCINHNSTSIGICLEGAFNFEKPTSEQLKSCKELINDIRMRRGKLKVYAHRDFNNTDCCGKNLTIDMILNQNVSNNNSENNNITGGNEEVKIYKNGSTSENVYSDSNFNNKVGSLNAYEKCECIVINDNVIVYYDFYNGGKKTGFVKWKGGIQ